MNQELVLTVKEQSRHNICCPFFPEAQSIKGNIDQLNRHLQFSMVCYDREGPGAMEHIGGHLT